MKDELITFETAKLAKEKGFNYPSIHIYPIVDFFNTYKKGTLCVMMEESGDEAYAIENSLFAYAHTQSLLQRWLREVHNIHVEVGYYNSGYDCDVVVFSDGVFDYIYETQGNISYEEALETGLQEALKLLP